MRLGAEQTSRPLKQFTDSPPNPLSTRKSVVSFFWFILRELVLTVGQLEAMQPGSWTSMQRILPTRTIPPESHNSFALFVQAFKRHDYSMAYLNDGGEVAHCHRDFLSHCPKSGSICIFHLCLQPLHGESSLKTKIFNYIDISDSSI